ncbi:UDP-N-acetylmuramate--L-alanine ligase [Pseudodesulfovibrio senegalensis]|uniref:UDP-N-acetylmuramate--L-alanine ligase n=1 Tax=Pseudodesulfovibrio senegalensis TaxID=1721087 RepID=A0A6N6N5B1_9BACT|nr:UDP-N-acetylmuramate--L-alanine ligase [Pseudodesulfovibrio senegalensis]KAB1442438.1 UDP-N-acetylmuramate--L-alanine ligase [Pseudodesulfovibrio senegalensis]
MRARVNNIHMVGIGGSGMNGIAEVLINMGFNVTGSDLAAGAAVRRLQKLGAIVYIGHGADNVRDVDVLVKSTAIPDDNPELKRARELGVPIIPRAEMLAELMRLRTGIAVAGTHGKTTTTSLLATIFTEAGYDPTVIIGGRLNTYGANARLGEGDYLIAEADESDGSFLCLAPVVTVVTNVDEDHMDFYSDRDQIDESFTTFMNKIPFYGMNVVCGDDEGVQRLLPKIKRPCMTYGIGVHNRLRGEIVSSHLRSIFKVYLDGEFWGEASVAHPGLHNVLNSLGSIGVAIEAGLRKEDILRGLSNFGGVGRRFERKGERAGVLVVDDYGHHPAEIKVTLQTARACYPDRRLVVAFQPHRFSRTKALFGDFCKVFEDADLLLLTEIYPASEAPIPGVNGVSLAQGIKQVSDTDVDFCEDFDVLEEKLHKTLKPGDLFLTLGAGSIWRVGEHFLDAVEGTGTGDK